MSQVRSPVTPRALLTRAHSPLARDVHAEARCDRDGSSRGQGARRQAMSTEPAQRFGSVIQQDPTILVTPLDLPPPFTVVPARLADLVLAAPVVYHSGVVTIEPAGDMSTVSIQRGSFMVAEFRVLADEATAAVVRLALIGK